MGARVKSELTGAAVRACSRKDILEVLALVVRSSGVAKPADIGMRGQRRAQLGGATTVKAADEHESVRIQEGLCVRHLGNPTRYGSRVVRAVPASWFYRTR